MAFPDPVILDRELKKEWKILRMEESRRRWMSMTLSEPGWKTALEEKIPPGVTVGLERAFEKALGLLFGQGLAILEKSGSEKDLSALSQTAEQLIRQDTGGKTLRVLHREARRSARRGGLLTGAEGAALGTLGIGLPDILIFLGLLLKGIRETALRYGFSCESKGERVLMLKMIAAGLSRGGEWNRLNEEINELLAEPKLVFTEPQYQAQLRQTASALTVDMLIQKFIQGVPFIGGLAGAANSLYYSKIMAYVGLKYRRRYLYRLAIGKGKRWNEADKYI